MQGSNDTAEVEVRGSFQEIAARKIAQHTVKHRDGGVGSVVANHRGSGESSVVVTTLLHTLLQWLCEHEWKIRLDTTIATTMDLLNIIVSLIFIFTKYYSVTNILLLTGLPSFDTLMINARKSNAARWNVNSNVLVKSLLVV